MQRIYREADRAAKIVRNLLVFAGSRRLVRRRTSVNATLSRVLSLRAPAFRAANIEVVRRHADALPRVKGDPLLLQQALLNIVLNAEQAIGRKRRPHRNDRRRSRGRWRRRAGRRADSGHRPRHSGGGDTARVRAVFHDKRSWERDGPRTGDYLWHHSGARRADRGVQPSRGRRGVHGAAPGRKQLVFFGAHRWTKHFLTTEEVLEYLQVNLRTVYRLIKAGKIPAVRVGRQWRFRKRDIDAWLDSQRPRGGARATPAPAPSAGVVAAPGHRSPAHSRRRRRVEHPRSAVEDARPRRIRRRYRVLTADRRSSGCASIPTIC